MATLTLTNVFGNNTTKVSGTGVIGQSSGLISGTAVTVTAGHRYYARVTVTCSNAGTNQSYATRAYFSNVTNSQYIAEVTNSPSAGLTGTSNTNHKIFTVPSGVTSITPTLTWGYTNIAVDTHTATFLLLVDITELETATSSIYTADSFWANVLGSTLFTTTKSITYTPISSTWKISDFNGTTAYKIDALYDNNGTTNYQIGKVYDSDGTASHLIYSAEFNAMTDVVWTEKRSSNGGFTNTNTTTKKEMSLGYDDYGYAHMYFPIDLSQYTKMTISCSYAGGYAAKIFGFSTNGNLITYPEADETNIVQLFKASTDSGSMTDKVYDISKYNQTTAYFKMYFYDGSGAGGQTRFTITKLIFE